MARMRNPWQVTGCRMGISSNARTGLSAVGLTGRSGQTRLLKRSLALAPIVSAAPRTRAGSSAVPAHQAANMGPDTQAAVQLGRVEGGELALRGVAAALGAREEEMDQAAGGVFQQ